MRVEKVEIVHWNPRRYRIPKTMKRFGPRKNNFGDLLGPVITRAFVESPRPLSLAPRTSSLPGNDIGDVRQRMVAVGSIMHMARNGDVIWGTGVNGKVPQGDHKFQRLDIRAVRGPLTADWLRRNKGIEAPDVYGDPGLLIPQVFPFLREVPKFRHMTLIPNLNEIEKFRQHPQFVSPTTPLIDILRAIAGSEFVVGSSLHAIVIADSLGIPAALLKSDAEPAFKYEDYYQGTGRKSHKTFATLSDAVSRRAWLSEEAASSHPLVNWKRDALVRAFPGDLWSGIANNIVRQ